MKTRALSFWRSLSPRRRKTVLWCGGLILAYAIIGFLVLPPIVRSVAVKRIAAELGREVSIEKVKFNPFALSTTIRGLLIKDPDGQPFVSWDEVYVNVQLSSFLGRAWVFKEIHTSNPFVRVQMNKDQTFNFSDLIEKFATNAPAEPRESKPLALRVRRLQIAGASAAVTDLTPSTPFHRRVGPIDVTLENFHTDPSNRNPYSFAGTTDAGEKFSWSGFFYLNPVRSQGEFKLENLALNKYAPLYQDFVRFQIRDGIVDVGSAYRFELNPTNRVALVTNSWFRLRSFQLAEPGVEASLVELPEFSVTGASVDATAQRAEVGSIAASRAVLRVRRDQASAVNVLEAARPAETNRPGGILVLLQSVTNAMTLLVQSTNQWVAAIHDVSVSDCAVELEDLANARPVRMRIDEIDFSAKRISNLPGTNLTASLSMRWNTNGSIRTEVEASLLPPSADVRIALDQLELRSLDPYLESKLNVFILDSRLGMDGVVRMRSTGTELPQVTFAGDVRLERFSAVDGVFADDLLKWGSVRVSGIDANLHPPEVSIREIAADDVFARLIIETNRTVNLLTALRLDQTNAAAAQADAPAVQPASKPKRTTITATEESLASTSNTLVQLPKISVATVVVSNALIEFTDKSMSPSVNLKIADAGGTVSGLSSHAMERADVNLRARVDGVGPVAITGAINPFRQDITNTLAIVISNVDLTPTSPYVGRFAGYRLTKGKLGMDLKYSIHGRSLKSENVITLDQFTFGEKVESPEATKLPVRLAIAILKDRNGRILLDVPIEGSLDDPEFKLNRVIVRTLVNILTRIATSPFSALGAVFGGGDPEELSFQDFAAGRADLAPSDRGKLDALAQALYDRPALQLDIEGSVDRELDREGLRRVMIEKRIRALKWMSMRKSEQTTVRPDEVVVTSEEREALLRRVFAEALSKGELAAVLSSTNRPGAATNSISLSTARALAGLSKDAEKGAATLMRLSAGGGGAGGGAATPGAGGDGKKSALDTMEQLLASSIEVGDSDFQALAAQRARRVREYLLAGGKVEAERLFLVERTPDGVKNQGPRAYFELK